MLAQVLVWRAKFGSAEGESSCKKEGEAVIKIQIPLGR